MNEPREQPLTTADLAGRAASPEPERGPATGQTEAEMQDRPLERQAADRPAPRTEATPLFPSNEADGFRSRWDSIQASFVDQPRQAVEQADSLVAEVIKRLADSFASERGKLEEQWGRGDDVDTEDLRLALQRYRSFFDRLLSV
jgi:hypothetical protein